MFIYYILNLQHSHLLGGGEIGGSGGGGSGLDLGTLSDAWGEAEEEEEGTMNKPALGIMAGRGLCSARIKMRLWKANFGVVGMKQGESDVSDEARIDLFLNHS